MALLLRNIANHCTRVCFTGVHLANLGLVLTQQAQKFLMIWVNIHLW